jgi:anti-anti-sigma regulatory factor
MDAVPESSTSNARVRRSNEGDGVLLTVDGALDVVAGNALVAAVTECVAAGVVRLDIDLSAISTFDDAGAATLLACRDAAVSIDGGLHYRTCSGGPGQDALLHAYVDEG